MRADLRAASPRELPPTVRCPGCSAERTLRIDRVTESGGLSGCVACGHPELWTRKRFPAATGVAIVIAAALLAPSTHYLSLVAAAVIDYLLYHALPEGIVCYVCGSEHRGFAPEPRHPRFDREIAERLKFGTRAVMGKPMREGGTAGAPDPEH
jgi:hypothetical protein